MAINHHLTKAREETLVKLALNLVKLALKLVKLALTLVTLVLMSCPSDSLNLNSNLSSKKKKTTS